MLGLAPAAHGANRTGRMFTGDRSGDFLYAAMWRAGLASQPSSTARGGDGLRLRGVWVTAAVRCAPPANRPAPDERDACLQWSVRELELAARRAGDSVPGRLCLERRHAFERRGGARAGVRRRWRRRAADDARAADEPRPRPRFGHGAEHLAARHAVIGCYHPSQQNTFTGRLTEPMIDAVLARAVELALGCDAP